jgi:hypothetical protein
MRLTKIYCDQSCADGTTVDVGDIQDFLRTEVATQYESFSLYFIGGGCKGKKRDSLVIEILTEASKYPVDYRPRQIANAYKKRFDQESVLITYQDVKGELV